MKKIAYSFTFLVTVNLLGCTEQSATPQKKATSETHAISQTETNSQRKTPEVSQSGLIKLSPEAVNHYLKMSSEFANPAAEYKPLTWYHVMSGNMSKEGLTQDLESMAEVGIGGTILFNVGVFMANGNVRFNSPEHIELIGHMAAESKRLGLSFGIHNCDGWSSSGGPWVTPEMSMKRVTWSETLIQDNTVQNNSDQNNIDQSIDVQLAQPSTLKNYYQDIAVIAYPALATEIHDAQIQATITTSDPTTDIAALTDHQEAKFTTIKAQDKEPVWLQFSYEQPVTIRYANVKINMGKKHKYTFHSSHDGINFTKHADMTVRRPGKSRYEIDHAFEGITAKYFRVVMDKTINIYEAHLSTTPTLSNPLGRSSGARTNYKSFPAIGSAAHKLTINTKNIRNLTADMSATGRLTTTLPKGNWTIMRFGYTSTGVVNLPASPEGRGLEVDKFSRAAFKLHYDHYVTNVINKVKKVAPNALHSLEIDSYEVGGQNWTAGYEQQFKQKYGYDLIPYLPLFAGRFVDSAKTSEAVLWDTRDLNNQLAVENYYGYFTELANQDGLKTYIEPYGFGPFNDVDVASKADIPMGEFWLKRDIYMMASSTSAAHLYNKNIISAESFTATSAHNWHYNPAYGKLDGDRTWALGVNQFVFHRFTHQPNTHVMPGMTMANWGSHLDRTQPWWDTAGKDWFSYIKRGQYLLRQGQAVADVLWYLGDAAPTTCTDRRHMKRAIPNYINYDCLNREKLQTELAFEQGRYRLNHGAQYKILYLTNQNTLYFDSVAKIHQFAKQGGVIIGTPIKQLAGRDITAEQQAEFERMVDFIWSQPNTYLKADWDTLYKDHNFDYDLRIKGQDQALYTHRTTAKEDIYFVYNNAKQRQLFDISANITGKTPELWNAKTGKITRLGAYKEVNNLTHVAFRLDAGESAFIVFSTPEQSTVKAFPIVDPQVIRDNDVSIEYNAQQQLTLKLNKSFVSQSDKLPLSIDGKLTNVPLTQEKTMASTHVLSGPWQVKFNSKYGLDNTYTFEKLTNWKQAKQAEIRAYSGTAVYKKSFNINEQLLQADQTLYLDLGQLYDSAQITLNGKLVGVSWMAPYKIDVTPYVKAGKNQLEIEVASSWFNRLITDEAYPDTSGLFDANGKMKKNMPTWYTDNKPMPKSERLTFTTNKHVSKDDPLDDAGLVGPVTLYSVKTIKL